MNSFRVAFSDEMKDEFRDRLDELSGGLESTGGYTKDQATETLKVMEEGLAQPIDRGLEAIILRFGRPAYFVQNDTFSTDDARSTSAEVDSAVEQARAVIEAAIPSVGRIDLRNHRANWVGTGWIVAPNVLVTNRHVAREFSYRSEQAFAFVEDIDGRPAQARVDLYREHDSPRESVFRLREVLWIEPDTRGHHDVAFLRIAEEGENDQTPPSPIQLMTDEGLSAMSVADQRWLAVIGYPAFSIYNNRQDQQRIFDGVFNVKRLQPGLMSSLSSNALRHDATTLGGNSGSVIVDLSSGNVAGLHFGGLEGETNYAVPASAVRRILRERVGVQV